MRRHSRFAKLALGAALVVAWAGFSGRAHGGGTLTALASFNFRGTNGSAPVAGVTFDANGNMFGTASSGGANGNGTVWEIAKGSNQITLLASFSNLENGSRPTGSIAIDANGNIYGTAEFGGPNTDGTVWELAKGSTTITVLASFNGTNGRSPIGGITMATNGNLYGTATRGGTATEAPCGSLPKGAARSPGSPRSMEPTEPFPPAA